MLSPTADQFLRSGCECLKQRFGVWVRQEESTSSLEQASEKELQACAFDAAGRKLPRYRWHLGCILVIWVAFFSRCQRYRCRQGPVSAATTVLLRYLALLCCSISSLARLDEPLILPELGRLGLDVWEPGFAACNPHDHCWESGLHSSPCQQ